MQTGKFSAAIRSFRLMLHRAWRNIDTQTLPERREPDRGIATFLSSPG